MAALTVVLSPANTAASLYVIEDCLAALSGTPGVQNVEVRAPSLEEIFVAYMQQGREA